MRYFNNALEDRRVFYIIDSGINPYAGSTNNRFTVGTRATIIPNAWTTTTPNPVDIFTPGGGTTATSTEEWRNIGAKQVAERTVKTPAEKDFEARYGTEIPRKEDGSIDTEAMVQAVVDYHVKDGLNAEGFSAERFANAGHDERMAMLEEMRMQNDAAKAAKFEEDLRLAQERDAAKAAQNNAAGQAGGGWGPAIASIGSLIQTVLA